jgi:hypothetical protein
VEAGVGVGQDVQEVADAGEGDREVVEAGWLAVGARQF